MDNWLLYVIHKKNNRTFWPSSFCLLGVQFTLFYCIYYVLSISSNQLIKMTLQQRIPLYKVAPSYLVCIVHSTIQSRLLAIKGKANQHLYFVWRQRKFKEVDHGHDVDKNHTSSSGLHASSFSGSHGSPLQVQRRCIALHSDFNYHAMLALQNQVCSFMVYWRDN